MPDMKILHTADWQLGIKLAFVEPERAAQLRMARFNTVRNIAKLAKEKQVDVVVVAGDVLDDNGVGRDTLQATDDALAQFDPIPVVLLPGNHDAGTADCALLRLQKSKHVHIAISCEPIKLGGGTLYPCPLLTRHQYDDPAEWIPAGAVNDGVRVAIAHGGALDFGAGDCELPNRIDVPRILSKGIDYVALGDWHGTFTYNERAWYSGTHEPTRFKEKDPGNVLVVEIASPGAVPVIVSIPVASTRWLRHRVVFSETGQVAELRTYLDQLPERASTLLELDLSGHLPIKDKANLELLLIEYNERLAYLRLEDKVLVQPTTEELAGFTAEGFIGEAANELRVSQEPAARDALVLLYRLMQEAR
jgi:DNA repair exonuclease SbcCD nuclease subunit